MSVYDYSIEEYNAQLKRIGFRLKSLSTEWPWYELYGPEGVIVDDNDEEIKVRCYGILKEHGLDFDLRMDHEEHS